MSISPNRRTRAGRRLRRAAVAQREVELGVVEVDERVVAETRMSMSGCSRWKASMRGSSHSEANEAKVVTLTRRRPRDWRICRTLASSRASQGSTLRSSICAVGA